MKLTPLIAILIILACAVSANENITRADALNAIQEATGNMNEMAESGFSIIYINDTIFAAKEALQRTDSALKMSYKGFSYADVIAKTNEVAERKERAYSLSDRIRALEIMKEDYGAMGIETQNAVNLLEEAKLAFANERYDEAESLVEEARLSLEQARAEMTIGKVIARNTKGFLGNYWRHIAAVISGIAIVSAILWAILRKARAKKKLKILKLEKQVLHDMIKETQRERFEKGKISEFTYQIRMQVYKDKLAALKEQIPVLEAKIGNKKKK